MELPGSLLSTAVVELVWNILWNCEQMQSLTLKEQARETLFLSFSSFIQRADAAGSQDSQVLTIPSINFLIN